MLPSQATEAWLSWGAKTRRGSYENTKIGTTAALDRTQRPVDSSRRRYKNDVGEVGADAIGVAGGQGPPSELSVCTDEEIRQRDRGRDRSRLLSPPFAVAAIGGGTSDRGARGKVDNPYAPRLYLAGCQLRLLVADTNLGDADGIGSGSVSDDTLGDGGRRPCVER